jgi:hypothetical protein
MLLLTNSLGKGHHYSGRTCAVNPPFPVRTVLSGRIINVPDITTDFSEVGFCSSVNVVPPRRSLFQFMYHLYFIITQSNTYWEWGKAIIIAVALALLIRHFLFEPYLVEGK